MRTHIDRTGEKGFLKRLMFRKTKSVPVRCPVSALFQVIEQDLQNGIYCNIRFSIWSQKYKIGAFKSTDNTYGKTEFYFDNQIFGSLELLKENAMMHAGTLLKDYSGDVLVTECNACYPRENPVLEKYYLRS